jgi:hypothetical protein
MVTSPTCEGGVTHTLIHSGSTNRYDCIIDERHCVSQIVSILFYECLATKLFSD